MIEVLTQSQNPDGGANTDQVLITGQDQTLSPIPEGEEIIIAIPKMQYSNFRDLKPKVEM